MPNGVASKDQMFLVDVYVFKYWQVLQTVQMSVGENFDQDGSCIGFSREQTRLCAGAALQVA